MFYFTISPCRPLGSVVKMPLILISLLLAVSSMIFNQLQIIFSNLLHPTKLVNNKLTVFYSYSDFSEFNLVPSVQLRPQFLISNGRTF